MPRIISPFAFAPDEPKDRSWMHIVAQSRNVYQKMPIDEKKVGYLFEFNRRSGKNYRLTGNNGDTVDTDQGTFKYKTTDHPPFEGWRLDEPLIKQDAREKDAREKDARETVRRWTYVHARDRSCKGGPPADVTVGYLFEHVLNNEGSRILKTFRVIGQPGDTVSTDVGDFVYVSRIDFIGWEEQSFHPYVATGAQSSPPRSPARARSCVRQTTVKYTSPTRRSPPFPANECCGERMRGNDGRWYESKPNVRNICTWRVDKSS
jgi:hypothetical protein